MMKKLRIIIIIVILTFSFSVKAEVFMEIDCDSKEITNDKSITCEGNLIYGGISIDDIEFEYMTNLDIEFIPLIDFNLNKNNNKVNISINTPLYDELLNSTVIMKFNLKANSLSLDNESLIFKNLKINNNDNLIIEDITESFNIHKTKDNIVLDNDCYLNDITIDEVSIPNFNKDVLEYHDIVVNKNIIFVDAIRSSNKSSAMGLGDVFIKPGESIIHNISVVSEDNTTRVYKLFITNKVEVNETELSKDNTLRYIEILYKGKKIPLDFNSKTNNYDINIEDNNLDKLTIIASLNDCNASFISPFGPRDIDIKLGNNKVLIKVKSESNDERVYTLNINVKDRLIDNNELLTLKINDQEIDLNNNKFEVLLPNDVTKSSIVAIPKNDKARVIYTESDLVIGNNKIIIEVVSVSGISKIYEVNVIREDKEILLADIPTKDNNINTKKKNIIIRYSACTLGVLFIILLIFYLKKKKKTLYYEII